MLPEERRPGDQRARGGGVELVRRRGEHDEVAGPCRVRHVGRRVGPVRDVAGLGLRERTVDHRPALRNAVAGPVVGVLQPEERRLDLSDCRGLVDGSNLLQPAARRVAARQVEVDLHGAAGPAGLGLADRLARRRTAVRRLGLREQAEVDQDLAGVDGGELRRESVVGGDERRRLAQQVLSERHEAVGTLVGGADELGALRDAPVGRAVHLHVVVGRVRCTVGQRRHGESEELVLELVGRRVADEGEVRVVRLHDVLQRRCGEGLPLESLLDVGLLADDTGLEYGEVGGGRTRELLGEVFVERAGEAGFARPGRPRGDGPGDGGVEEPHLGEVLREGLDLDEEPGGLAVERPAGDLHLHVGPLPLTQRADAGVAVLRRGEQHLVVVHATVVGAVEEVRIESVLVDTEVEHAQAHLHRRAERARGVGPTGRRDRSRAGEGCLAGEAGGMVELDTERGDEVGQVGRRDVVRRHPAARVERAEVDRRALDRGLGAAGVFELDDLLATALGGLADRLGLGHAGREGAGAVRERLTVDVERVVRRPVDARPGAGREAVPTGPGVGRRLGEQAAAGGR